MLVSVEEVLPPAPRNISDSVLVQQHVSLPSGEVKSG